MAARESTILRDTSDTIGMPPLRATHSPSDSDLGVHSSNINNDMGSQPSAFMFNNAAKMTHQLQQGDAEPLRAASPSITLPAPESAQHHQDIAIDNAFAAKYNEQIDNNLSIEEVIVSSTACAKSKSTTSTTATRKTT